MTLQQIGASVAEILFLVVLASIVYLIYKNRKSKASEIATPDIKVTVTTSRSTRPIPIVDFTKLEGFDYTTYKVVGRTAVGQKKTKKYDAISEVCAKEAAEKDGLTPESITALDPEPASDRQKEYARDLGLSFDDLIPSKQISYLISAATEAPATEYQLALAQKLDIKLDRLRYKSQGHLYSVIRDELGGDGDRFNFEVTKAYVYSVLRYIGKSSWETPADSRVSEAVVDRITQQLVVDPRALKSILRQAKYRQFTLLAFDQGESRDTVAYKTVREMAENLTS